MIYNPNNIDEKSIKRFFKFVQLPEDQENDCWVWTGATNKCGYGEFWYSKAKRSAHRFAYFLYNKSEDISLNNLYVCHTCDNPHCVNPNHLFLGTHNDNMVDKKNKLRAPHDENNHFNKYTTDDLCSIIRDIVDHKITSRKELREATDVSEKLILDILSGKYRPDVYNQFNNLSQYLYLFKTHLTKDVVLEIRRQLNSGIITAYRIAKNMDLPYSVVSKIKNNKTYQSVV